MEKLSNICIENKRTLIIKQILTSTTTFKMKWKEYNSLTFFYSKWVYFDNDLDWNQYICIMAVNLCQV